MRNKKLIILFSVLLFVTLLAVFNSVLFSVRHVDVHCQNMQESQYSDRVKAAHKIKNGSSIFFVDKAEAIESIERDLGGAVRVLSVERVFPDRIYIDYVEVRPYLTVSDGTRRYSLGNDMRVIVSEPEQKTIALKIKGALPDLQPGDKLEFASPSGLSVTDVVIEIFSALERLGYYDTVINFFDEIDISGNFIVFTTATGMKWEIVTADKLTDKLILAMSVYTNELTDEQRSAGTLVIAGSGKIAANYRPAQIS